MKQNKSLAVGRNLKVEETLGGTAMIVLDSAGAGQSISSNATRNHQHLYEIPLSHAAAKRDKKQSLKRRAKWLVAFVVLSVFGACVLSCLVITLNLRREVVTEFGATKSQRRSIFK